MQQNVSWLCGESALLTQTYYSPIVCLWLVLSTWHFLRLQDTEIVVVRSPDGPLTT